MCKMERHRIVRIKATCLLIFGTFLLLFLLSYVLYKESVYYDSIMSDRKIVRKELSGIGIDQTDEETEEETEETVLAKPPLKEEKCQPQKVIFLKVHKAGSTTMQEFFQTYAKKYNFTMSLSTSGPWLGGYPGPFLADFHQIVSVDF